MPRCTTRAARARVGLPITMLATVLLVAAAVWGVKAHAADPPSKPAAETTVKLKAFPPSVLVDAKGAEAKDESAGGSDSARGRSAHVHIDDDDDFEATIEKMPWIIGLIFLVVGSIFLTPVVLVVGIVWYKLRKTRLQNEAMLALAERGIVPPAQAAEALAAGTSPASVAPQLYQQAVAKQKRVAWSDLRKGIIMSMLGLGSSLYSVTGEGTPNWLGLVLIFVGLGYIALWWLEGRHLEHAGAASEGGAKPGGG